MTWCWIALIAIGYLAMEIVWYFLERVFMPYKEGEYTIDYDGIYELTEDMQRDRRLLRCILWPIPAVVLILVGPFGLLSYLFDKYKL